MFKRLTTVIIEMNKWLHGHTETKLARDCGGNGKISIFDSKLLNEAGEMCCLGQWCQQAGVTLDDMIDIPDPEQIESCFLNGKDIPFLTQNGKNTEFANRMMAINDSCEITTEEQIEKLKTLAKTQGVQLIFQE